MDSKKITIKDIPITKVKIEVDCIKVDGKAINLTPVPHSLIEKYITHTNCNTCGVEFKKPYTYSKKCTSCIEKQERDNFYKLELVEWDGETPLHLYSSDNQYFFDISEIEDYCEEYQFDISDLMLVTCVKTSFSEIDLETITSDGETVYEDWEPSKEFEAKLKEFNSWLTSQDTHTWFPSNKRIQIDERKFSR